MQCQIKKQKNWKIRKKLSIENTKKTLVFLAAAQPPANLLEDTDDND